MTMTVLEMYEKVRQVYEQYKDQYFYLGLRFEDKDREIGEVCEWSKDNPDREDEREFPEYGTEEYGNLPLLDGTSSWDLELLEYDENYYPGWGNKKPAEDDKVTRFFVNHAYIIGGNQLGHHDHPDYNEILIKDAVVLAKIF